MKKKQKLTIPAIGVEWRLIRRIESLLSTFKSLFLKKKKKKNYLGFDLKFYFNKVHYLTTYSHKMTPFSNDFRKSFGYANFLPDIVLKNRKENI